MQGSHQLAQKTTSAGRPCAPFKREERVACAPARCSLGSDGAWLPSLELPLDAKPKIASAAITAAARATVRPSRTPLLILALSVGGQQRHVVGDLGRLEVRRVDRQALAGAGDAVDEPGVLDQIGVAGVAFGAHAPFFPGFRKFLLVADQVLHFA